MCNVECMRCQRLWKNNSQVYVPHPFCGFSNHMKVEKRHIKKYLKNQGLVVLKSELANNNICICYAYFDNLFLPIWEGKVIGRGVSKKIDRAINKSIWELAERLDTFTTPKTRQIWSGCDTIEKLGFVPDGGDNHRWWIEANKLNENVKVFVPLELFGIESLLTSDDSIVKNDSTGISVHSDIKTALEFSKREILERVMLRDFWLSDKWNKIDKSTIDNFKKKFFNENEYNSLDLHCFVLTMEGHNIGAVSFITSTNRLNPAMVCGAGCELFFYDSVQKSIYEAYAQYTHAKESDKYVVNENNKTYLTFKKYLNHDYAKILIEKLSYSWEEVSMFKDYNIEKLNFWKKNRFFWVDRTSCFSEFLGVKSVQISSPDVLLPYPNLKNQEGLVYPL